MICNVGSACDLSSLSNLIPAVAIAISFSSFSTVPRSVFCERPHRSCFVSLRESSYRAVSGGTRGVNEEPQVARKGRPFSPLMVTQSAGRSTGRPGHRPRLSRSYAFSCRHYIRYIRGVGVGPISHGRLELRPYATGISCAQRE